MKINLPLLNFCLSTFNSNKLIASKTLVTNKMVQLFVFVTLIYGFKSNAQAVIIASSVADHTICPGSSVTFTATPIGEGASTSYQWYIGAVPVGENNVTFTTTNLVNGDEVSVVMTTDSVDFVSENRIIISTNPLPNAGTDGTITVCAGIIPTETELFEHLGGSPDEGGTWTNLGSVYTYTVSSNSPCNEMASAKVVVIEKPINAGVVSVTNNGVPSSTAVKVCSGSNNITLTLSESYGNIQWLYSNTPTGSYRSIPEENDTTLVLSNLMESGTVYYYAKVSCSTTVFTNKIAVTVQKSIPGSISGSGTICSGNTKILNLVGSSETIQWQTSATGVIGSYKNIESKNGVSYTTPALMENAYFQAVVQTGDCMPVVTQPVLVVVNKPLGAWTIQETDTNVCYGKQAVLRLINNEKNIYTSIVWYKSINAGLTWAKVSGQISATLSSGNLTVTTWFKAMIASGTCYIETPMAKVTVAPTAKSGTIITDKVSVCQNGVITFSLNKSVGSTYDWQTSPTGLTGTFSSVGSGPTFTTSPASLATLNVRCVVTNTGCSSATTSIKKVIVDKAAVAGTIKGGGIVNSNSIATIQLTGYVGKIQWEFSTDGVNFATAPYISSGIYTNPSKATTFNTTNSTGNSSTYTITNSKGTNYFRAKVTNGSCSSIYTEAVLYRNANEAITGTSSGQVSNSSTGSSVVARVVNSNVNHEKQEVAPSVLSVLAYPNPSSSVFNLEFISSVSGKSNKIQVYNMNGQLIEQLESQQSENVELGSDYASGIYNVIVTQGDQIKTLKLIKK